MKPTTPTWRPPRLTPTGFSFAGLAPRGHVIVGVLAGDELADVSESAIGKDLRIKWSRRVDRVLMAEVLDVGERCPGVAVGDRVIIQRFSGAASVDPDRLSLHTEALGRFSGLHVVRCGNGIRAQDEGNDEKLVGVAHVVAGLRSLIKANEGATLDDPRMLAPRGDLAKFEALLMEILRRRAGKCVNGAVLSAGLQTGDDGAVFDGVIAVVEREVAA